MEKAELVDVIDKGAPGLAKQEEVVERPMQEEKLPYYS